MIISLMAFIAVFSAVVIVHELGHFLAARRAGIKVYEFSIGFPFSPKLLTVFRHKETEFTVRLLPFGGFVSFSKDGDEDAPELFSAAAPRRACILSGGPAANIAFSFLIFIPVFIFGKHLPFFDALLLSAQTLWAILSGTAAFILAALSGTGSLDALSGPVGIAAMAGQAAGKGVLSLMYFTGVLSASLGIMNLIPLPALDGGQLVMLLIESARRKPLSVKTYQAVNLLGLSLFIALTVLVTYKDVVRLLAGEFTSCS